MSDEESHLLHNESGSEAEVPALDVGEADEGMLDEIAAGLHPNVQPDDPNPYLTSGKLKLRDAMTRIKARLRRRRRRQLEAHNDSCIARNRDAVQYKLRNWPEWVWNELPVYTYILNYITLDVVIVISARAGATDENDEGATTYNPLTMIVMSEAVKMLISFLLWLFVSKKPGAKFLRRRAAWFALPAGLYTTWYMLNFVSLINVQSGQYTVFMQVQYFFYIFLWALVFRKKIPHPSPRKLGKSIRVFRITSWQWGAVAVLCFAVCLVRVTEEFTWNTQGKPWWGLVVLALQALVVAAVGVFNEYLYKNIAFADIDLNQQNMYLYTFTLLFSTTYAGILIATESSILPSFAAAFHGFFIPINILILCLAALLGLQVSLILKENNNLVRVFAQAVHVPGQLLLTQAIAPPAGRPLKTQDDWIRMVFGSVLIAVATIMMAYNGGFHTQGIVASGRKLLRKKRGMWGALSGADALVVLRRKEEEERDARRALANAKA